MLEELIAERKKKLEAIQRAGIDPYPAAVPRTVSAAEVAANFDAWSSAGKEVSLVGRIMAVRSQGQIAFVDVRDESGKIQVVLNAKTTENCQFWLDNLDRGDFASFTGSLFRTQKGEMSIAATRIVLASKSLRPLPTEWYGVEDEELRFRERYVELALKPEVRELFRKKSVFWKTIREFLLAENFLEVETGVLEAVPGGAEAEPFVTHHNTLDTDFYLRISLELPLKRLIVGGYEKVFELGRIFRNEGIDREHLQDYTQLEFYWAYHDYRDLMKLTRRLYQATIEKVTGGLTTSFQGQALDWSGDWPEVDYCTAFREKNNGLDPLAAIPADLERRAKELGLAIEPGLGRNRLIDLIYKKTVRPTLIQPCFLIDPPVVVSPLAKRSLKNPEVAERVQIVAGGTELSNGFTELNDPLDQRARFEEQMKLREAGDKEAQMLDEDFLHALEYGMPPTTGFGMSERLFSVLMDQPIRECVFFPLMKPKG
ncbi:MAG: lysine--tRNA ligase [Candidatus Liptonbacteria bacterium]|nr:lysine--tRNA ligase [Candidatus Liptonbacteria bacterium]